MEFLTIFLSGLLAFLSPAGLVIDRIAQNAIRSRFEKVEQLQVRVDNPPTYQLLQGKVERVRVAGRGLWLNKDVRIDALELETDPIDVDLQRLRQANQTARASLKQPVQTGVRLVFTEKDINQSLKSPAVMARLQQIISRSLGSQAQRYELRNPQVKFLGDNRLRLQAELIEANAQPLAVTLESKLGVVAGRQIQLSETSASVNGKPFSPLIVAALTAQLRNRLDLRTLEDAGIIARLLKLNISTDTLDLAAFVRVETPGVAKRN